MPASCCRKVRPNPGRWEVPPADGPPQVREAEKATGLTGGRSWLPWNRWIQCEVAPYRLLMWTNLGLRCRRG